MFQWIDSGPFHRYGFGLSQVLFDRSPNPCHVGLGEIWGHTGSSHNFVYYWPMKDAILITTLNQINCQADLYDDVASIMRLVLAAKK
jgi:hypothetical protein